MGRLLSRDARDAKRNAALSRDALVYAECKGDWARVREILGLRRTRRLMRAKRLSLREQVARVRAAGPEVAK